MLNTSKLSDKAIEWTIREPWRQRQLGVANVGTAPSTYMEPRTLLHAVLGGEGGMAGGEGYHSLWL
jgi:hypothetical protein